MAAKPVLSNVEWISHAVIAWPGQALAYKMGQLTILKLRDEAKTQLGEWKLVGSAT